MSLVSEAKRFIAAHIVERVVIETPEEVTARQELPSSRRARMAMNILSLGIRGRLNPEVLKNDKSIIDEVRKAAASLHEAEQKALRPPRTALRWKFLRR